MRIIVFVFFTGLYFVHVGWKLLEMAECFSALTWEATMLLPNNH